MSATILLLCFGFFFEESQLRNTYADDLPADPVGDLDPQKGLADLRRLEGVASAWNSGHWEDALKKFLQLPDDLRPLATHWASFDGIEVGEDLFPRIRDRAWRHLRDRLALIDSPGNGQGMLELLPRLDRIHLICSVTGMPGPAGYQKVRDRWQRRVDMRLRSDLWIQQLQDSLNRGDEEKAAESLLLLDSIPWVDEQIQQIVEPLVVTARNKLWQVIDVARQESDPGWVLDTCHRLEALEIASGGASNPVLDEATEWAIQELKSRALQNLDMRRDAQALLQMARLVVEKEALPKVLDGLRAELTLPLRPEILPVYQRSSLLSDFPLDRHALITGVLELRQEFLDQNHGQPLQYEPVGRHWIRSPDHLADAKRWVDQIDDILSLTRRWLESPASEATLIRDRIQFHVIEARRLAERMEKSPARRSRVVWEMRSKSKVHKPVKVTLHCPVTVITDGGREILTAVECSEILLPRVIEGVQLPVRSFAIEAAERRLRAKIPGEIELLADRWANDRLAKALKSARELAEEGAATAALELLLPALLGADDRYSDLRAQAIAEVALWSGLGSSAVEVALGGSETP
ncbi:MAG: hypothetical protein CBC13_09920 [Planctomycetia bacterium TMED53]|nr:MAG: hypothetical protein CBC13_09920 [Planctomycetia bacterium TMED53]